MKSYELVPTGLVFSCVSFLSELCTGCVMLCASAFSLFVCHLCAKCECVRLLCFLQVVVY